MERRINPNFAEMHLDAPGLLLKKTKESMENARKVFPRFSERSRLSCSWPYSSLSQLPTQLGTSQAHSLHEMTELICTARETFFLGIVSVARM
jgi:hypothetical protein